jgi:hypothetical protein
MFSLKSLLLAVLVAAVFVVAFLNSSPIWASVIVTLTILVLIGLLIAVYLVPAQRPFLVCASIMGALYLGLALCRPLGVSELLVTTRLMFNWWLIGNESEVDKYLIETGFQTGERQIAYKMLTKDFYLPSDASIAFGAFQAIGHCAVALILAVIAGLVGSYVARQRASRGASHVQS